MVKAKINCMQHVYFFIVQDITTETSEKVTLVGVLRIITRDKFFSLLLSKDQRIKKR